MMKLLWSFARGYPSPQFAGTSVFTHVRTGAAEVKSTSLSLFEL